MVAINHKNPQAPGWAIPTAQSSYWDPSCPSQYLASLTGQGSQESCASWARRDLNSSFHRGGERSFLSRDLKLLEPSISLSSLEEA